MAQPKKLIEVAMPIKKYRQKVLEMIGFNMGIYPVFINGGQEDHFQFVVQSYLRV